MNTKDQIAAVFIQLKKHLKESGVSYRDLADRVGMSESNVKRIFSVQSCDLERLIQFCEATELKFFDLISAATESGSGTFELSTDAEDYFVKNFDCFIFFRELSGSKNISASLTKSKQPKEKLKTYMTDLVRLGLILKTTKGYEPGYTGHLKLSKNSKLRRKLESTWVPWFFNRVLSAPDGNQNQVLMFSSGLSKLNQTRLTEELSALTEKYREIGMRDQRSINSQSSPIAVCIGIGPYRVGNFNDLV